jgi:membrane protease YdiL (CAAX protease family)
MTGSRIILDRSNRLLSLSLTRPASLMLALFLGAVLVKILDTFVLRLDERLGEAILTKSLGFLLVLAYLWACGRGVRDIGFHRQGAVRSLLIGGVGVVGLYVLSFGAQLIGLRAGGQEAALALTAVDPKSGMSGGLLFGIWMVISNLVNSAMEEGLFRGLMLRHFRVRFKVWGALLFQASLFAVWHLNWPIKNYLWHGASPGEAGFEAISLLLATFISGLLYGYLYQKTDNLWGPFLAHTINNTVLNMLFIRTAQGMQTATEFGLFLAIWLPGHLLLILVFGRWAKRWQMPQIRAWGDW